jgi:aryl-alcohol dehydrogenase-like predicted oxidoreductase
MIAKQPFGRTGYASTRIIFGGYALSEATQEEADRVLKLLLEYGINHIDVAPMYGDAEKRIRPWMETNRDDFFLATKSRKRSYEGARKDLKSSLSTLGVDYVDLWQMHGLTNPVGWEKAMGPEGALQAFIEAREEGLVRFLGVTAHGPKAAAMHRRSLERFDFDSVLLPYYYLQMQKTRYATDAHELIETCRERNVAVQTIKSLVRRPWGTRPQTYNTYFYEPLETQSTIDKAVHWALGLADTFVITTGDMQLLPKILDAASRFENAPSDAEMDAMVDELQMDTIICSVRDFR